MEFTDNEKATARTIVASEKMRSLIIKIMSRTNTSITMEDMKKNDEELGQLFRADALAEQKVAQRVNILNAIGVEVDENGKPKEVAPE